MLTRDDLLQIRVVVQEEVRSVVREEVRGIVKEEVRKLNTMEGAKHTYKEVTNLVESVFGGVSVQSVKNLEKFGFWLALRN